MGVTPSVVSKYHFSKNITLTSLKKYIRKYVFLRMDKKINKKIFACKSNPK